MSGARRQLVDFVEQTKVYNHLKAVTEMVQLDSGGTFYLQFKRDRNGEMWDDAKIGEKFGYSRLQIKDFRRKHVGKENPGGSNKPFSRVALMKRLDELEGRVSALENYITTEIEGRTNGQGNDQ